MLKEFRYQGVKTGTKTIVRGSVFDKNIKHAGIQVNKLARNHRFVVRKIEEKKTFLYRAINEEGKKVSGEQEAFSKQEIITALESINFKNIKVDPKLFNFNFKPPQTDIIMFISLSSDMLKENMKYDEILKLLTSDIQNTSLRNAIKNISRDLRQGQDGMSVFMKYEDIFGKFVAYMLGLASKSGNMAEIYDSTAKFIQRRADFQKNLRKALLMPAVTMVVLIIATLWFILDLIPTIASTVISMGAQLPAMTEACMNAGEFITSNWWWLLILAVSPFIGAFAYFSTDQGKMVRDTYVYKLPIIGNLIHKMNIEVFFRVFSIIYSGSGNNIEVLRVAAEACGNLYMEKRVKEITIPKMLRQGSGLIDAVSASGVFTDTVISRLKTGSSTGSIRVAAEQLAGYYEKETSYKFEAVLAFVDLMTTAMIFGVTLFLMLVSMETSTIKMNGPGGF
jgi:type IV pilus assembly protein PilC